MKSHAHFGILLGEIRAELNMNQIEFAEMLGVSQSALSKMENDAYQPKLDLVQRLVARVGDDREIRRKLIRFVFRPAKRDA